MKETCYPGTETPITSSLFIAKCNCDKKERWYLYPVEKCAKCGGKIKCTPVK